MGVSGALGRLEDTESSLEDARYEEVLSARNANRTMRVHGSLGINLGAGVLYHSCPLCIFFANVG